MLESFINRSAGVLKHVSRSRLFLKIFCWFWITTIAIHVAFSVGSALTGVHVVPQGNMYATVAPLLAAEAVDTFETGGRPAFTHFSEHNFSQSQGTLFLLDGFYADVLARPLPANGILIAKEARLGQLTIFGPHLAAYRYLSRSGRPYTLLLSMHNNPSELREIWGFSALWFVAAIGAVVTLLCWWLTYHIVSPVQQIQTAAREGGAWKPPRPGRSSCTSARRRACCFGKGLRRDGLPAGNSHRVTKVSAQLCFA